MPLHELYWQTETHLAGLQLDKVEEEGCEHAHVLGVLLVQPQRQLLLVCQGAFLALLDGLQPSFQRCDGCSDLHNPFSFTVSSVKRTGQRKSMAIGRALSAVTAVATCTTELGFMTSLNKGIVPKGICSSPKIALCLVECPVTYCKYFPVLLTRAFSALRATAAGAANRRVPNSEMEQYCTHSGHLPGHTENTSMERRHFVHDITAFAKWGLLYEETRPMRSCERRVMPTLGASAVMRIPKAAFRAALDPVCSTANAATCIGPLRYHNFPFLNAQELGMSRPCKQASKGQQ